MHVARQGALTANPFLRLTGHRAVQSRSVPSHEYGHFVLCNLLERESPAKFALAYNEAATDGILGQTPDKPHVVINEAFVGFITGQIAGAVDCSRLELCPGGKYPRTQGVGGRAWENRGCTSRWRLFARP